MPSLRSTLTAVALMPGLLSAGCRSKTADPALAALQEALRPGERVIALRALDPSPGEPAAGMAVVVRPGGGGSELRLYGPRQGTMQLLYATRQGDAFLNLVTADVDADGRAEVISTWGGGHLTLVEVTGRRPDGEYGSMFQNAGREIEQRPGPAGTIDFLITSRTFDEKEGQPPAHETTLYRWDGKGFAEVGP